MLNNFLIRDVILLCDPLWFSSLRFYQKVTLRGHEGTQRLLRQPPVFIPEIYFTSNVNPTRQSPGF